MERRCTISFVLAAAILVGAAVAPGTAGNTTGSGVVAPAKDRGAQGATWHTDYRKAVSLSARLKRPLLLNFTGSDWCDRCLTLKEEVFDTPEFTAWARKTVVLVELDFPQAARQDARLRKRNAGLRKRFSESLRDGYPTILFLDPSGARILGEVGYREGGPGAWIDAAEQVLNRTR